MRKIIPILLLVIGLLIIVRGLMPPRYSGDYDIAGFAELPVQTGGRVMPLDSVAINTLKIISQKSAVRTDDRKIPAIEWLLMVAFSPQKADKLPVFRIDNAEVLGMLGIKQEKEKYFSYNMLLEQRDAIGEQANNVNPEAQLRSVFERQLVKLAIAMNQYERLKISFHAGGEISQLQSIYDRWVQVIEPGREAFDKREKGEAYNEAAFQIFATFTSQFIRLSQTAELGIAPPLSEESKAIDDWANVGEALLDSISTKQINPVVQGYLDLAVAYQNDDPTAFNQSLENLHEIFAGKAPTGRVAFEEFFNNFAPFYQASILYVLIFIIVAVSWLGWTKELQQAAFYLLLLAFVIHTFGLCARMYIQGRPPVTNLYSSAIFIGWGAVLLGIILERVFRGGVGAFTASIVGFITLVIAYNLAKTGDTLEMMRAVLDSNFWLATHVVIITIGYSSVFLAGALATYYIIKRPLGGIDNETKRALYRMVYGITCFSLLFSFVGTMLGGIWADQSWGRFWGWDPKENGALIIVLWCALMLHARWCGWSKERGFMALAVGGNMVTAWSWFGTNLLGVGLHSYGFTDSGFFWMVLFWLTQAIIIGLAYLPERRHDSKTVTLQTDPT
ncbi:cytochrome c biogenesis protein [Rubellicoccus peritrichatus]|uniref:Cytochrome c biogenesis protein CcsA n=1 Tax=Rubellicoccus peritrichatus TaxID=3080537 RepID=A0AAQ3LD09_9BACT|nr:cytochrome c biogenesis protein CcsA [Puniceicoccus sp. CR14]WOO43460.1 cytochrome c biogenesis protein CcsA [Puniceicoccus sp. CR14]